MYERNNECRATDVIWQDWSNGVVALFLEDWGLGRVASSCHMTMDLLCQEMRDACWDSSEVNCHSKQSRSLTVDGLRQQRREMP